MGNRKFHTLPLDTWTCLWKEVHTASKNNHYLSICIQKCKSTKFWWMLSYPSCSQEISVKVICLILLLVILIAPLSQGLCLLYQHFPGLPTNVICYTMLAFNMYVFLSLLSSHLSLGLHWSPLPPVLPHFNSLMASLSSFMARFLVCLSWPALVIVTVFWSLCTRYSLLIHYLFQWLF